MFWVYTGRSLQPVNRTKNNRSLNRQAFARSSLTSICALKSFIFSQNTSLPRKIRAILSFDASRLGVFKAGEISPILSEPCSNPRPPQARANTARVQTVKPCRKRGLRNGSQPPCLCCRFAAPLARRSQGLHEAPESTGFEDT